MTDLDRAKRNRVIRDITESGRGIVVTWPESGPIKVLLVGMGDQEAIQLLREAEKAVFGQQ